MPVHASPAQASPVYAIHGATVTPHAGEPAVTGPGTLLVRCERDLADAPLSIARLTALHRTLTGGAVARGRTREDAVRRLWALLQAMPPADPAPPPATLRDRVLGLLRREQGATLDELVALTGWRRHSVRALLSATVRKRLGLPLVSETVDGRVHRLPAGV